MIFLNTINFSEYNRTRSHLFVDEAVHKLPKNGSQALTPTKAGMYFRKILSMREKMNFFLRII